MNAGTWRLSVAVLGLALLPGTAPSMAMERPEVPAARDLAADGGLSRALAAPIVLVVTRAECGYCELLKSSVIVPMIISGEYRDRAVIRELNIDSNGAVADFSGREASPFAVANRYDALLTPTVLILGPDGAEVAPRLVGINNELMYLWYLDRALEVGAAALAAKGDDRG